MFQNRIIKLRKSLSAYKIGALIVSSAVNIQYLIGYSNFSKVEREAYLFVTESSAMLFTDGRYIEAIRNKLPKGIKVFLHAELFKKIRNSKAKRIGIEHDFTEVDKISSVEPTIITPGNSRHRVWLNIRSGKVPVYALVDSELVNTAKRLGLLKEEKRRIGFITHPQNGGTTATGAVGK